MLIPGLDGGERFGIGTMDKIPPQALGEKCRWQQQEDARLDEVEIGSLSGQKFPL